METGENKWQKYDRSVCQDRERERELKRGYSNKQVLQINEGRINDLTIKYLLHFVLKADEETLSQVFSSQLIWVQY